MRKKYCHGEQISLKEKIYIGIFPYNVQPSESISSKFLRNLSFTTPFLWLPHELHVHTVQHLRPFCDALGVCGGRPARIFEQTSWCENDSLQAVSDFQAAALGGICLLGSLGHGLLLVIYCALPSLTRLTFGAHPSSLKQGYNDRELTEITENANSVAKK